MSLIKPNGTGREDPDVVQGTICPVRSTVATVPLQTQLGIEVQVQVINVPCHRKCMLFVQESNEGRCGMRSIVVLP